MLTSHGWLSVKLESLTMHVSQCHKHLFSEHLTTFLFSCLKVLGMSREHQHHSLISKNRLCLWIAGGTGYLSTQLDIPPVH